MIYQIFYHIWQHGECIQYHAKLSNQNLLYDYSYDNVWLYMGKKWKESCITENDCFIKIF